MTIDISITEILRIERSSNIPAIITVSPTAVIVEPAINEAILSNGNNQE
jgi:hypothetical protein